MLECINNKCQDNSQNGYCTKRRIPCKPIIRPNKEEQSIIERLRKELEGERKANIFLENECNRYKELSEARGENNKKFDEENQKLKAEKQCLTSIKDKALEESKEYQRKYVFLKNQFDNNIKVIEDYSAKITILEEDNKEYKRANEGLAAESKERLQTIKKLQRQIEDNTENAILRNRIEDLEKELKSLKNTYNAKQTQWENEQVKQVEVLIKENTNLNELIEKKDIKIERLEKEVKSLKEVINEGNEQLETEYTNKIIIAEQKINRLNTENTSLKEEKEKSDNYIQQLINALKGIAKVL